MSTGHDHLTRVPLGRASTKSCVVLHCCLYLNSVVLLVLEIDDDIKSSREPMEPHLMSAVQCVALRILEVVAEFLLKGEWTGDLINKWKELIQILETVVKVMPFQMSKYCPGSFPLSHILGTVYFHTVRCCHMILGGGFEFLLQSGRNLSRMTPNH